MTSWETGWLSYAREMLNDESHLGKCLKAGGARPIQDAPYSSLRWPGYLGEKYARILCLGMIHSGDMLFAGRRTAQASSKSKDDLDKAVLDLEPVVLEWTRDVVSDDAYISQTRVTYSRALPHWNTWSHIGPILEQFGYQTKGDKTSAIAYANIAKCWSDTNDDTRKDIDVMTCCNDWKVGSSVALIKAISPACVLVATTRPGFSRSDLPLLEDGFEPDVWAYNFRTGIQEGKKTDDPTRFRDVWAKTAAESYKVRMQSLANSVPRKP